MVEAPQLADDLLGRGELGLGLRLWLRGRRGVDVHCVEFPSKLRTLGRRRRLGGGLSCFSVIFVTTSHLSTSLLNSYSRWSCRQHTLHHLHIPASNLLRLTRMSLAQPNPKQQPEVLNGDILRATMRQEIEVAVLLRRVVGRQQLLAGGSGVAYEVAQALVVGGDVEDDERVP